MSIKLKNKDMTTKEKITAKIKELGYNSRQVSVHNRAAGYSSALVVTVRDASISLETIENAVNVFEKIDRCQASGEILSGGNTYVNVEYSDAAEAQIAAPFIAAVEKTIPTIAGNTGETVLENYILFGEGYSAFSLHFFGQDGAGSRISQNLSDPASIALALGKHKLANVK